MFFFILYLAVNLVKGGKLKPELGLFQEPVSCYLPVTHRINYSFFSGEFSGFLFCFV